MIAEGVMIIPLDEKAQEILGTAELVILTERVDDVVLGVRGATERKTSVRG